MFRIFIAEKQIDFNNQKDFIHYAVDNLSIINFIEYYNQTSLRLKLDFNRTEALKCFIETIEGGYIKNKKPIEFI